MWAWSNSFQPYRDEDLTKLQTTALVPIKLNNERLPGKNLLGLPDGSTLLDRILVTLSQVPNVEQTIVYCSDSSIRSTVEGHGARFLRRDPRLDLATATSNDILAAFADDVDSDVYLLAHATAPFIKASTISAGISAIESGLFDSSLSVERMQTFYWRNGRPANYDPASIPRTQDLEPLLVETSGFYAFKREVLTLAGRRTGEHPALIEVSRLEALDVDVAEDFELASAIVSGGWA